MVKSPIGCADDGDGFANTYNPAKADITKDKTINALRDLLARRGPALHSISSPTQMLGIA